MRQIGPPASLSGRSQSLESYNGSDLLYGDADNDIIYVGWDGAPNEAHGGPSNDLIIGGYGSDLLTGDDGNDEIYGMAGEDYLFGNQGDDYLDAGQYCGDYGYNYLHGGLGDDVLMGSEGGDRMVGDYGNDLLYGLGGDDNMDGGYGNDKLHGGATSASAIIDEPEATETRNAAGRTDLDRTPAIRLHR